jgi:hypothetical protein
MVKIDPVDHRLMIDLKDAPDAAEVIAIKKDWVQGDKRSGNDEIE